MRTHYYRSLSALLILLAAVPLAHAQTLDNKGKDFIMGFIPNFNQNYSGDQKVELHLTSDVATSVTVQYPVNAPTFNTTVAVTPGSITIVTIPFQADRWPNRVVANNAVRAFANDEFVVYMINRQLATSDAALALPVDVLNTEYIVTGLPPTFANEFVVVAAFDGTTVTITPTSGAPATVTLNRGQGYMISANADLTGSIVSATKPVTMTNGENCANIPPGTSACDHVFEVAQPVQSWGTAATAAPLPNRTGGSIYRVVASEDNTKLSRNGSLVATLNRGQSFNSGVIAGPQFFSADKPIFATQFMTGQGNAGATLGDPAMGNVVPDAQFLRSYTFSTIGGGQFVQNFLSVIAQNTDIAAGTIRLDGTTIPAASFTPIPGTTNAFAVIRLSEGVHTSSSNGFHGITVEGYNSFDSYLYPGGGKFQFINQAGDPFLPVCSLTITNGVGAGNATDNRASEDANNNGTLDPGEDANGNGVIDRDTGIFFVQLADGSTNLTLTVPPFTPGVGSIAYSVARTNAALPGSGVIVVTDGAGNSCRSQVNLGGEPPNKCMDPATEPSFNGALITDGARRLVEFLAPQGATTVEFYSTSSNLVVGAPETSGGAAIAHTRVGNTFTFTGTPPTAVRFALTSSDAGTTSVSFFVRVTDTCQRTVNLDPQLEVTAAEGEGTAETALLAPAPNPFGGSTRFGVVVAEAGAVRVSVFDALGREVARLVDGPLAPGRHAVTFDGAALPAGVYVVRMSAGAFHASRTVTLLQ